MVPFLFLLVAEAMSSFLTAQGTGSRGLKLPISTLEELLDADFADDTTVYLQGGMENLRLFALSMETFCRSSAPTWRPVADFQSIVPCTTVRYLGRYLGIDISPEQQITSLLLSIWKKLLYWSTAQLSLVGRVVVANHILLATMWYISSCWAFSRASVGQVQGSSGTFCGRVVMVGLRGPRWSSL